ncbi:MAG: proline dehydrogenase family protein, partial [Acidobacteriota bacterium]
EIGSPMNGCSMQENRQEPLGTESSPGPTSGGGPAEAREPAARPGLKSRLIGLAPKALVRLFARPYIAGETRREAIELVHALYRRKQLHSTLDVLGEALRDPSESEAALKEYKEIIDDLGDCPYANISIKLSALGQAFDEELCARNLEVLLRHAQRVGQFVRFDMEDHTTTDSTLRLYRRMVDCFPRIGPVLQARLHRTPRDIEDLAALKPNVRLCLGIYREPQEIALQDKQAIKERLLELLRMLWSNGQYVAVATHDESVIARALQLAGQMGKTSRDFEVQMLLGVPRERIQRDLIAQGIKVRLYVPYGRHWYQYCLRRLENNPEMARMVLVNLLRRGFRGF